MPTYRNPYFQIFLFAFFTLSLELVYLRLFAVALFSTLSTLSISCALLGLGIGVVLAKGTPEKKVTTVSHWLVWLALLSSVLLLVPSTTLAKMGMGLFSDGLHISSFSVQRSVRGLLDTFNPLRLGIAILLASLPFVTLGYFLANLTLSDPKTFPRRYFCDLMGASVATFVFDLGMRQMGAFVFGMVTLYGIWLLGLFGNGRPSRMWLHLTAGLLVAVGSFTVFFQVPSTVTHRSLASDWSALGFTTVLKKDPKKDSWMTLHNLATPSEYLPFETSPLRRFAGEVLEPAARGKFVELACGAGRALRLALDSDFKKVIGVDIVDDRVELLKKVFHDDPRNPFTNPRVEFYKSDARTYIKHATDIDLLQIVESTFTNSANLEATTFTSERLATVEAFQEYFASLSPKGAFYWVTYIGTDRDLLFLRRMMAAKEAWQKQSKDPFDKHFLVLRDGLWIAAILSRRPIQELKPQIQAFLAANKSVASSTKNEFLERASRAATLSELPRDFTPLYQFDYSPVHDMNPQGYTTLSFPSFVKVFFNWSTRPSFTGPDFLKWWTLLICGGLLLSMVLLGILFLRLYQKTKIAWPILTPLLLFCFSAAAASVAVETSATQVLIPILGTLDSSLIYILAPFLAASGLGSWLAEIWSDRPKLTLLSPICGSLWAAVWVEFLLSSPLAETYRLLFTAVLVIPAGICLGYSLPSLIRSATKTLENASEQMSLLYLASFLGSVLGIWVALFFFYGWGVRGMQFGPIAIAIFGAAFYGGRGYLTRVLTHH